MTEYGSSGDRNEQHGPACTYCGNEVSYVPQYSSYYCRSCNSYRMPNELLGVVIPNSLVSAAPQSTWSRSEALPDTRPETPTVDTVSQGVCMNNVTVVRGDRTLVESVSLKVESGTILGILGPSGAGKSTIIKVLTTEYKPAEGYATIQGNNVVSNPQAVKAMFGYVPQELQLYENLTFLENVLYFGAQYGLSDDFLRTRAVELARAVELEEKLHEQVKKMSGGQKKRVSIAVALAHNPAVAILDEPTSGLDPGTRRTLWRFLKALNQKLRVTMLVSTHFTDEAEYCDSILVIHKGRVIAHDRPDRLKHAVPGGGKTIEIELLSLDDLTMDRLVQFEHFALEQGLAKMVDRSGYRIKVFTDSPAENFPSVVQRLSELGLGLKSVSVVEASLEDVFVYLTGDRFSTEGE